MDGKIKDEYQEIALQGMVLSQGLIAEEGAIKLFKDKYKRYGEIRVFSSLRDRAFWGNHNPFYVPSAYISLGEKSLVLCEQTIAWTWHVELVSADFLKDPLFFRKGPVNQVEAEFYVHDMSEFTRLGELHSSFGHEEN